MHDSYSVISKSFLTSAQCDEIIANHDCNLEHVEQSINRKVNIKEIDLCSVPNLVELLNDANNKIFRMDINGETECYFARYDPGNHYDKFHIDSLSAEIKRKVSFSIFLNDDFEVGNFEMLGESLDIRKGKLCVFPSFLPHRVTAVTAGTRYVIFGFLLGPRLK